jgi:AcrR family transcriptional regulator
MVAYNAVMSKPSRITRPARTATPAKSARPAKARTSRTAGTAPKAPASKAARKADKPEARYHHGDLHGALLTAARVVLEREGLQGLTLRAVAREAGVSHAAPTHHFGDATGLVSELAAIGFRNFNAAMTAAGATGTTPTERALARARAYLAYARAQPEMYQLMFRTERLDMTRPGLREAANASFAGLAGAIGARHPDAPISAEALSLEQAALIARGWSLVHGFTMLLLDGRLGDIMHRLPEPMDEERLFLEMLKISVARPD